MRIPVRHLDRAFPELDRLADRERARTLRRARIDGRVPALVSPSVAMLVLAGYLQLVAPRLFERVASSASASDIWFWMLWVGFAIGAGAAAGLISLIMRDGLVRRALRMPAAAPRCTHCRHSLAGLPTLDEREAVQCPECGVVAHCDDIGASPAEFA
ncbi:MAG: hypothetical protein AAFY58_00825 [Planctomycetota bacterium]